MFRVLEHCDNKEQLYEREQFWLDELRKGRAVYNIGRVARAPMLGRKMSASTKRKMSRARKGISINKGRKMRAWEKDRIRHGVEKLNAQDIHKIRDLISQGVIHRKIAESFGVSRSTIWSISDNRYYRWVE